MSGQRNHWITRVHRTLVDPLRGMRVDICDDRQSVTLANAPQFVEGLTGKRDASSEARRVEVVVVDDSPHRGS
jgi:hypothetical protein